MGDEERQFMHFGGGKKKHLNKEESLFPPTVLRHLCETCGGYAFKWGMTDKDLGMICDACEQFETNSFCRNRNQPGTSGGGGFWRRLSDDSTDNSTVAPVDTLQACGGDEGKLDEAKNDCKNLTNADNFDQCCYDVCVTLTEKTVSEEDKQDATQAVVVGAAEAKQKLDEIA